MKRATTLWPIWVFAAFCWIHAGQVCADESQRNVLILFSNESSLPANQELMLGLQSSLRAEHIPRLQIFDEYLDSERFKEPGQRAAEVAYLKAKYATAQVELAIAVGPQAFDFLLAERNDIVPDASLVFTAVGEGNLKLDTLPPRTTGIVSEFDPVKTVELALAIQPGMDHIAVITGASPFDKSWEATAREKLASFESRFPITYLSGLPLAQLLSRVRALPPNTAIVYLNYFQDGTGQYFIPRDVAEKVALAANVPTYGLYDTYLGRGVVGGYMSTFEALGRETGLVALRVLSGAEPEKISPHEAETHRYIVDWRQVERWGLNAAALPAGTEIRFKEPTAWEQYKAQILIIIAVLILQTLLLAKYYAEGRRRRLAQRLAEESRERMDAAISGADLGLWNWNVGTDMVWATDECRMLLGLGDAAKLTRGRFLECLHPEDRPLAVERMAEAMRSGKICTAEYRIVLTNGSERWIFSKATPKTNAGGAPDHLIGVAMDISERKRTEREAERQRQELAHLTRVSVVGALSGALAHELNQPLTAILSNAEAARRIIEHKPIDTDEIRHILEDIMDDDKRAGDVIHHLRSLLRKDDSTREMICINALAASVIELCRSDLILKSVTATTRFQDNLPAVLGDFVQLQQVLLNLIVNACEAMAGKPVRDRLLIVITERAENGSVRICVSDSGEGIPANAVEEILQPFFTTKSYGLGLGLPICQWIVTAHGGRLSAENNPAGGATFYFELPSEVEAGLEGTVAGHLSRG